MKKTTKIMAALFIALVVMTGCANEDEPVSGNPLAGKLVGEWITEIPVQDLEYTGENGNIDIPSDADLLTIIYHFFNDGTAWKEIDVMKGEECIFQPISRYDFDPFPYAVATDGEIIVSFPDGESSDILHFDGKTLKLDDLETQLILERASEAQMKKYASEADKIHGGNDENIETGISNGNADDVSRAGKR